MSPFSFRPDEAGQPLLDSEDVRLLVELGFTTLMRGFLPAARDIFAGVVAARPAGDAGLIGLALVQLHAGAVDEAVATLRAMPPTDPARLFLATALQRRGDGGEARAILDDLAATAAEPYCLQARALLHAMHAEARG